MGSLLDLRARPLAGVVRFDVLQVVHGGVVVTGWDLKPQGIQGVLKTTGETASKIQTHATSY
ncbi:DUF6507 family protein, partial [Streptomyces sp. NPDC001777]|uniref:DUF6507 family protein n=1 Tax=Streptomyces sp. NPDC001777 TaxID=3364608 RepID=UPI0036C3E8B0